MKNRNPQKVVIYGGMFDPPHRGHFALIKAALRDIDPVFFYVVPAFGSPFKAPPGASFKDRAAMLEDGLRSVGLGGDSRIIIHPYEAGRGRVTYTWRTVAFFRRKHPSAELHFLMGSDCLGTFRRWRNFRRITAAARLLVGVRAGFPPHAGRGLPYGKLAGRFPSIASTSLKAGLFSGSPGAGLLKSTANYIVSRGLYTSGLLRKLEKSLPPERFRHSLGTARLALDLARRHGADPSKAAIAALLHDAARRLPARAMAAYASAYRPKMPGFRDTLKKAPIALHACAGAVVASEKFGITDREVLKAVRTHALGCSDPGILDKIIFTADFAEPGRAYPEAREIRRLAYRDLDAAYARVMFCKLKYGLKTGRWIHPESVKAWNSLLEKNK